MAFDERRRQAAKNLETIFHIGHVPCDTGLREGLDPVDPEQVRPVFRQVFAELGRGKILPEMLFLDDDYLLALAGTEYFLSVRYLDERMQRGSSCPSSVRRVLAGFARHRRKSGR